MQSFYFLSDHNKLSSRIYTVQDNTSKVIIALMNNLKLNLPIFPLPLFLLPGGVTRLRIFETRYLNMVRIASNNNGFVIWPNNKEQSAKNTLWGSWVEIINFDQGDDGVLEIDVKCQSLVELSKIEAGVDKLHFGQISIIEHWSQIEIDSTSKALSRSLIRVFENDDGLDELYPIKDMENESWVVARWLELLPVQLTVKTAFISKYTYLAARKFIQSIILK